MEQKFVQMTPELQKAGRVLIAVSTGVDSMVLLRLMEKAQVRFGIEIGVVHVNHQLREESVKEAEFLQVYCQDKEIPCYEKVWEKPAKTGIEVQARKFRYAFFAEVMEQENYSMLLTAHHGDDQVETMLMRFARGGTLLGHAGIQRKRPFASGDLLRPLLPFTKQDIIAYAEDESVPYFEDTSNASLQYTRNRIRHQVLPVLKEENSQLLEHAQQFQQQLTWAEAGLRYALKENLNNIVYKANRWTFIKADLPSEESLRYYFLTFLFEKFQQVTELAISQRQVLQLVHLLDHGAAQWSVDLAHGWQFSASYQMYALEKRAFHTQGEYALVLGDSIVLSENEHLALRTNEKKDKEATYSVALPTTVNLPLVVRRRKDGDRIQLTETLRKKVSRYFIDQKVSQKEREQAWVVADASGEVVSVLPFVNSYLSISNETDRIHYILDYYLCY